MIEYKLLSNKTLQLPFITKRTRLWMSMTEALKLLNVYVRRVRVI